MVYTYGYDILKGPDLTEVRRLQSLGFRIVSASMSMTSHGSVGALFVMERPDPVPPAK